MIGAKYILDGKLKDVNSQSINIEIKNSIVVYEVFTWENNNAIFFDEHYHRMVKSIEFKKLSSDGVPSKNQLEEDIERIVSENSFDKKNIRIDLFFVENKLRNYTVYFTKSIYPTNEQYKNGVKVGLCFGERKDPHSKIANSDIRALANKKIADNNLFEILLVDSGNLITEGSRSNVFFVKGNILFTPKSERVLEGITRQKVIEIAKKVNIEIKEIDILLKDIDQFDSAFLTSTSMIVLPICNIENINFEGDNEVVKTLYSSFLGLKR